MAFGPRRRATDHVHPEYWTEHEHEVFESRMADELEGLRSDVKSLSWRVAVVLGGVGVLAFLGPLAAELILRWAGL